VLIVKDHSMHDHELLCLVTVKEHSMHALALLCMNSSYGHHSWCVRLSSL